MGAGVLYQVFHLPLIFQPSFFYHIHHIQLYPNKYRIEPK